MTVTLDLPLEVDQTPREGGRLLAAALPLAGRWEQGVAIEFYGCGEPDFLDNCVTATDAPKRPDAAAKFKPFPIRQGATCSTLSRIDAPKQASNRLDTTTEWALERQLATDEAGLGNPSFEDADVLGTVADADFVHALSCLEQAASDAGVGTEWVLHAPIRAAAYLADRRLLVDGKSPTGATWVFGSGYPVQGPTTVRLWATGPVWAAESETQNQDDADWQVNSSQAFAQKQAIVAFNPCINIAIDVTVPACP